uniref:THAP-type domain-containing protein n=2 Tax=Clastoptera arizonana TaxID=38151 RepID=A0A1B6C1X5_9HEMI
MGNAKKCPSRMKKRRIPKCLKDLNERRKVVANTVCAYGSCNNSRYEMKRLRMFRFPIIQDHPWVELCGNSALIGLSPDVLFRTKRICEDHFRQEDILPSGRLSNGAMPIQYIPPKSRESPPLLLTKAGLASSSPRNYSRKPSSTTSSASFPPEAIQTIIKEEYDVDEDNNSDNFPTNNELPVQENYSAIEPEFTEDPLTIKNSNILLDESESYSSNAIGQNLCEVTSLGKPQKVNRDSIKDDYSNLLRTDTVTEFQNHPNSKLEEKLRIEYIKFKIKNEEDISNLKKEAFRLQVHKEKMEIQFLQEAHEQKMKNLKLEYELLQSQLQKTKL